MSDEPCTWSLINIKILSCCRCWHVIWLCPIHRKTPIARHHSPFMSRDMNDGGIFFSKCSSNWQLWYDRPSALKCTICFDCIHHSRSDLCFVKNVFASPSREVRGQVSVSSNTPQELVGIHCLAQGHFSWVEAAWICKQMPAFQADGQFSKWLRHPTARHVICKCSYNLTYPL